ncbi:aspartate carbamoyltransferase regulatory chain [Bacteroidia bacterium]|nr:aspartate carbamoyltransferase regulatory chain [Bacteroidia bacterium]
MAITETKRFEVRAIENGTVIDHIAPDALFKIIRILGLERDTHRITFGLNLESGRMGKKAIIKINDRYCEQEEINRISIFSPNAVVNIIRDFQVVEKLHVAPPDHIEGFVRCINPTCITNNQPVRTSFEVNGGSGELSLRCRYCEKITPCGQIELR